MCGEYRIDTIRTINNHRPFCSALLLFVIMPRIIQAQLLDNEKRYDITNILHILPTDESKALTYDQFVKPWIKYRKARGKRPSKDDYSYLKQQVQYVNRGYLAAVKSSVQTDIPPCTDCSEKSPHHRVCSRSARCGSRKKAFYMRAVVHQAMYGHDAFDELESEMSSVVESSASPEHVTEHVTIVEFAAVPCTKSVDDARIQCLRPAKRLCKMKLSTLLNPEK